MIHIDNINPFKLSSYYRLNKERILGAKQKKSISFAREELPILTTKEFLEAYASGQKNFRGYNLQNVEIELMNKYRGVVEGKVDVSRLFLAYTGINIVETEKQVSYSLAYPNFSYGNYEGLDLSNLDFKSGYLFGANMKNTKAFLEPSYFEYGKFCSEGCFVYKSVYPQKDKEPIWVYTREEWDRLMTLAEKDKKAFEEFYTEQCIAKKQKSIKDESEATYEFKKAIRLGVADFSRQDLSEVNFDDINIAGLDLSFTKANIDPQKVTFKDMRYGNYEGLNFYGKNFFDVKIENANLSNTGAFIDLEQTPLDGEKPRSACLNGCFLFVLPSLEHFVIHNYNLQGAFIINKYDQFNELFKYSRLHPTKFSKLRQSLSELKTEKETYIIEDFYPVKVKKI